MNSIATATHDLSIENQQGIKLHYLPPTPNKLQDLDISQSLIEDLMLRYLYTKGSCSISELSDSLKLTFSLLYELFQQMRKKQLFEITGMEGSDYIFTLSGNGRDLAAKRFAVGHYSGPAPVSLKNYKKAVQSQVVESSINPELLKKSLSELVVTKSFLDQLGPALASQKPIFLYGPTGNGKTSVATRLFRTYNDFVLIPYAIEVDGQIIVVYDPVLHKKITIGKADLDRRWVVCRRPCVVVGGELEPDMLELQLEESTKVYAAPLQMKANNGMLIIDDFGRQRLSPRYLLNRWIVPLDRREDYLSLQYGLKFRIPFEMIVIFATNLDPNDLADEAFLRRIQNKIYVEAVNSDVFEGIFHKIVTDRKLVCEPKSSEVLRMLCLDRGPKELRACYPSDIIDIIVSTCAYESKTVKINRKSLERAVNLYFAKPLSPPEE